MAHEQKTQNKPVWLDTSLLPWWKNVDVPPKMMFTLVYYPDEKTLMYPLKWCSHKWRHTYKNDQQISFDP